MKLLDRIVRRFHSVEVKTSKQQLLDDFGEFPPTPLRCESLKGDFKVVRTHGIGTIYQDFVKRKTLFRAMMTDPHLLLAGLMNRDPSIAESLLKVRDSKQDLIACGLPAFGIRALFSVMMPITILYMMAKGVGSTRPTLLGFFNCLSKNELQINILSERIRKNQKSEDSNISHEHLHLLQHTNPEDHSIHVKVPQDYLNEEVLSNAPLLKELLYLMKKVEVEARLHECVLSFYRAHRHLPLTISGFLGLLASSREFGEGYVLVLKVMDAELRRLKLTGVTYDKFEEYSDRDSQFTGELQTIVMKAKTHELMYRFINEVLTVMYGNLLKYYGDPEASQSYLEGIPRPNLYDELYSVQTA